MDSVEFYRDGKMEWRWARFDEGTREIIGESPKSHETYLSCYENAYSQFEDTVEYVKWPHEDTNDPVATMEIHDDDGSETSVSNSEGT